MNNVIKPETGAFISRISLGAVLLAHSLYLKLFVFTLGGTAGYFASIGLPGSLAYIVFTIELVAGLALILGIYTRQFSALVIPVLFGATWAHMGNGWIFSNAGGGWEYPLFLTIMAAAQVNLGEGSFALGNRLRGQFSNA